MDIANREEIEWTNTWIERANDEQTRRILIIGGSVARSFRRQLSDALPYHAVDFVGLSSSLEDPILYKTLDAFWNEEYKYEFCLLNIGGNHGFYLKGASNAVDADIIRKEYAKFLKYVAVHCPKIVLLTTTPNKCAKKHDRWDEAVNAEIKFRNDIFAAAMEQYGGMVIDLYDYVHSNQLPYSDRKYLRGKKEYAMLVKFICQKLNEFMILPDWLLENPCDMLGIEYDFVVSIGENCAVAAYLKQCNLRDASYPFDWIGNYSLIDRARMIVENSYDFLTIDSLTACDWVTPEGEVIPTFCAKKSKLVFLHDFDNNSPLEKQFQAMQAKYVRRIARMNAKLETSQKILFCYRQWGGNSQYVTPEDMIVAQQILAGKYPDKEINLLVMQNDCSLARPIYYRISDNVLLVKHYLVGDGYKGNIKNNLEIFSQINLKNLWKIRLKQRLLLICIKILKNLLHPFSHKKRHEFAEKKKKQWLHQ